MPDSRLAAVAGRVKYLEDLLRYHTRQQDWIERELEDLKRYEPEIP